MKSSPGSLVDLLRVWGRILSLRATESDFEQLEFRPHFLAGWACVWLVGAGRWWDDATATFPKSTGVGSAVYVFVLAFFLYLLTKKFAKDMDYAKMLIVVCLSAPPALVYAFPIERFDHPQVSVIYNSASLALVSIWRVAIMVRYLRVYLLLTHAQVWSSLGVLVSGIVLGAGSLGALKAIGESMGGYRDEGARIAADIAAGAFVVGLVLFPLSLLVYWFQYRNAD